MKVFFHPAQIAIPKYEHLNTDLSSPFVEDGIATYYSSYK